MENLVTEAVIEFKLGKKIGKGGEGNVYHALDLQTDTGIAIKKVPLSLFPNSASFFHEAKKISQSVHENIVEIKYGCKDKDFVYIAMPFFKYGDLKSLMDERFLTSREIVRYSLQFLSGLNHIHGKKLVHFDIKPENILISDARQAIIADFGHAMHTQRFGFADRKGTTEVFAPPEYFSQARHNFKFDIYQAGITLYRMCVGDQALQKQIHEAHFHRGNHHANYFISSVQKGQFPLRSSFPAHIPNSLRKVIQTALQVDPNKRYSSAFDMLNDIAKLKTANDWQFTTDDAGNEEWTDGKHLLSAELVDGLWQVDCKLIGGNRKRPFCKEKLNISQKNALTYKCIATL